MNRVKQLREEKNVKQVDLAAMLNISQATLSNWERGIHDPDNESLSILARYFDCSIDYLLQNSDVRHIPELGDLAQYQPYFRTMERALDLGIAPKDIQTMLDFLVEAKERDENIGQ